MTTSVSGPVHAQPPPLLYTPITIPTGSPLRDGLALLASAFATSPFAVLCFDRSGDERSMGVGLSNFERSFLTGGG